MPALDGLRALSICLVLTSHANVTHLIPGGLGVVIFFVISGFLISRLMIAEVHSTGTLHIGRFYMRRVLRLLPTILLFLVIFTPLLTAMGANITSTHVLSVVLYFANYYHLFIGYPLHSPFPTLWSLAVEEHFYVLFPIIVWLFRGKIGNLLPWLCASAIAVLLWRLHLSSICNSRELPFIPCGIDDSAGRIYKGTDSIVDCILIGAIASFGIEKYPEIITKFLLNFKAFWLSAFFLMLTLVVRDEFFRETFRYTIQCICIAIIVLNIIFGKAESLRSFLENPLLVMIGRLSYALYVFHFPVIKVIELSRGNSDGLNGSADVLYFFGGTFALAALTYFFVEIPIKKLRGKYRTY